MATFKSHVGKMVCVNGGLVKFNRETYTTECEAEINALKNALNVELIEDQKPSIDDLRAQYEELYGEKPHGNFGETKLSELIAEKQQETE